MELEGFEPSTPCMPCKCSAELSYSPGRVGSVAGRAATPAYTPIETGCCSDDRPALGAGQAEIDPKSIPGVAEEEGYFWDALASCIGEVTGAAGDCAYIGALDSCNDDLAPAIQVELLVHYADVLGNEAPAMERPKWISSLICAHRRRRALGEDVTSDVERTGPTSDIRRAFEGVGQSDVKVDGLPSLRLGGGGEAGSGQRGDYQSPPMAVFLSNSRRPTPASST